MGLFTDNLADLPLFSEVSRSEMAVVRRHLTPLRIPAGRVLVQEGTLGDEFMIIAEGQATVSQDGHTIAILGRGDLVGEMALLDHTGSGRRNATGEGRHRRRDLCGIPGGVPPDSGFCAFRGSQGQGDRGRTFGGDRAPGGLSQGWPGSGRKSLLHEDAVVARFTTAIELSIAQMGVQGDVLGHGFVRVEPELHRPPMCRAFSSAKLHQAPAQSGALHFWIDRDDLNQERFLTSNEADEASDGSAHDPDFPRFDQRSQVSSIGLGGLSMRVRYLR